MKASNGAATSQPPRRAVPAGRVVPALPLTMTKKPARPAAKQNNIAAVPAKDPEQAQVTQTNGKPQDSAQDDHVPAVPTGVQEQVNGESVKTPGVQDTAAASLSNVTAPSPSSQTAETTVAELPSVSSRPPGAVDNVPASQESAHKPAESFDLHAVQVELPGGPRSNRGRPPSFAGAHPPPPQQLIFGGQESSSGSSPAMPLSVEGSGFLPPPFPPAPMHGHSHHFSDPHVPRGPHSGHPLSPMSFVPPSGFPPQLPHHTPNGSAHLRHAPREPFFTNGTNSTPSYRGRNDSYTSGMGLQSPTGFEHFGESGKTMFAEPKPAPPNHGTHIPLPPPPNGFPQGALLDGAESLRNYLLSQFGDPQLADCVLMVSGENGLLLELEAHRLILARSPTLLALLRAGHGHPAKPYLSLQTRSRFFDLRAFTDSVRHLYGGPLPIPEPFGPAPPVERMVAALGFVAAGSLLKVDAIAHRAMDAVLSLLRWDTIPIVLPFALEGGLSAMWDDGFVAGSPTSSGDQVKPESGLPMYEPYATDLLHRVVEFAVHTLPHDFYIDPSAAQLDGCPRLPMPTSNGPHHERRNSRINPRLSQIRFGQIPSDELQRPSPEASVISSVLLSVPFALLKSLLEHPGLAHRLGPETAASVTRQVVHEREQRRQRALKAHTAAVHGNGVSSGSGLAANLYIQESVEHSEHHASGCRLVRRRVYGVDTPVSEGT